MHVSGVVWLACLTSCRANARMEQQSSARCSVHLRLVSHGLSAMATRDERVVAHAKELQDFMRSQEPVLSKQKYQILIDKQFGELKKQLGAAPLSLRS